MSRPIEDYGFIGNMVTGALVGRDGSMDWLCLPRFDADACFAALLGTPEHGRWLIAPEAELRGTARRYLPDTAVLETTFETEQGAVALIDFMPLTDDSDRVEVVRLVKGLSGRVQMQMDLVLRFGYGRNVPWVRRRDYGLRAVAGPDTVELLTPVALRGENMKTKASFAVEPGESVPFTLAYHPSNRVPHFIEDRQITLERTVDWWTSWARRCQLPETDRRHWQDAITRSLITLKALTFKPTGGIAAALTTSLPEEIGGVRNWDYRFCWIRDATLTLYALLNAGYFEEAGEFREWLLRAAAGHPEQMQIMYGIGGERRLTEVELPWLPGYEGARPVRVGNAAYEQLQLDVYGELMDALHAARKSNLDHYQAAWRFQCTLLNNLKRVWREPDEGIWEVRGGRKHFVYSKVMAWVAFDRGIKAVEQLGLAGPVEQWREACDAIRADVLANGYDASRNTFVQHYGSPALDASLLLLAATGFLAADDPRFRGTVEAIERDLIEDGLVLRYRPAETGDGLPGQEGTFLVCSFWLADAYTQLGRFRDAALLFDRLLALTNDLGLLAEQYEPRLRRQLGNFPQAFSHIGLVNTAYNLLKHGRVAEQRADRREAPTAPDREETGAPTALRVTTCEVTR